MYPEIFVVLGSWAT